MKPCTAGILYILPRGYDTYKHSIKSSTKNEDGTYTVTTNVVLDSHDGCEEGKAVTLFVKNSDSQFGYNIISSDIITTAFEV